LKDLFRAAGNIIRADVKIGPDGSHSGTGTVVYETSQDAQNAIGEFNLFDVIIFDAKGLINEENPYPQPCTTDSSSKVTCSTFEKIDSLTVTWEEEVSWDEVDSVVEEDLGDVVVSEEALVEEEDMAEDSEEEGSEVNKVDLLEEDSQVLEGSQELPLLEVTQLVLEDSVTMNLGSFNLQPKSTSRM